MTAASPSSSDGRLAVIVAGGGVAALEATLALAELAGDRTRVTVVAPSSEFVYRPLSVREPFAYGPASRYELAPLVTAAGAELLADAVAWVDPARQTVHTRAGESLEYGALLLALGAKAIQRYTHALTIEDVRMDELLHGLIQDVEAGYIHRLAFVSPGRLAWPLPLYELALMTAGRAYDMNVELAVTLTTPEPAPLAIFGERASAAVEEVLTRARVDVITSAQVEVPKQGEVSINAGERSLSVDRVVAMPELYGPSVRGIPLGENGFLHIDRFGKVSDSGPVYAAGDATEFPIKHGGLAAQQADAAAASIAALAGAPVTPEPSELVIRAMLLTDDRPLYLSAQRTGGGFHSEVSDKPSWDPPAKIAAKYLAPYLAERDRAGDARAASANT